jgi:hypothetical protein
MTLSMSSLRIADQLEMWARHPGLVKHAAVCKSMTDGATALRQLRASLLVAEAQLKRTKEKP